MNQKGHGKAGTFFLVVFLGVQGSTGPTRWVQGSSTFKLFLFFVPVRQLLGKMSKHCQFSDRRLLLRLLSQPELLKVLLLEVYCKNIATY